MTSKDPGGLLSMLQGKHFTDLQIRVGTDPTAIFDVHKVIMSSHSDYFFRLLSDKHTFKESVDSKVDLPDEDPDIFKYLVVYFYGHWGVTGGMVEAAKLFAMADYFDAPGLKAAAIADLVDKIGDLRRTSVAAPGKRYEPANVSSLDMRTVAREQLLLNNLQREPEEEDPRPRKRGRPKQTPNAEATLSANDVILSRASAKASAATVTTGTDDDYPDEEGLLEPTVKRAKTDNLSEPDAIDEIVEVLKILSKVYRNEYAGFFQDLFTAIADRKYEKDVFQCEEVQQLLRDNHEMSAHVLIFFTERSHSNSRYRSG